MITTTCIAATEMARGHIPVCKVVPAEVISGMEEFSFRSESS